MAGLGGNIKSVFKNLKEVAELKTGMSGKELGQVGVAAAGGIGVGAVGMSMASGSSAKDNHNDVAFSIARHKLGQPLQ